MPYTESGRKAVNKYRNKNYYNLSLTFSKQNDEKVVEYLSSLTGNRVAYVKELIYADLKKKGII